MTFNIAVGFTSLAVTGTVILPLVANATIPTCTMVITNSAGTEVTLTINTGDTQLTGLGVYNILPAQLGGTTAIPTNMYMVSITAPGSTKEVGCVVLDTDIPCEIHKKVLSNITLSTCKNLPYHIMWEVVNNINEFDDCNCCDGLDIYAELKTEVSADGIIDSNIPCSTCQ